MAKKTPPPESPEPAPAPEPELSLTDLAALTILVGFSQDAARQRERLRALVDAALRRHLS